MSKREFDPGRGERVTFGFEEVGPGEKTARVRGVFSSVARSYDLMNDLMSLRLHRAWKDAFAAEADPGASAQVLDMAGGTGDVAERLARLIARRGGRGAGAVTLCDYNEAMVAEGAERPAPTSCAPIRRLVGDAQSPPFPDKTFDLYTIAFGIRNVAKRAEALREARRVLKRGGKFCALEFSRPAMGAMRAVYDAYSFNVIPALGRLAAGDADSYRYLVESIRRFPDQPSFAREIEEAGFARVTVRNLTGGVAAIWTGRA